MIVLPSANKPLSCLASKAQRVLGTVILPSSQNCPTGPPPKFFRLDFRAIFVTKTKTKIITIR